MYNDKEEIKINVVIEYDYNLDEIKEIIKQIVDIKGVKKLDIEKVEK